MLITPPNGKDEIIDMFGDANHWNFESENIVMYDLPYTLLYEGQPKNRARCHRLLVENFQAAFEQIQQNGLQDEFMNFSGDYVKRNIRGANHPSTHSWGIGLDMEAEKYPLGSHERMPEGIIQIFSDLGFLNGANFNNRKDPMHFQFATGY